MLILVIVASAVLLILVIYSGFRLKKYMSDFNDQKQHVGGVETTMEAADTIEQVNEFKSKMTKEQLAAKEQKEI